MTPYPTVRPSYPLSEVKAGVSCDPPSRCDRHDRYQFPSSRREGCFRDSEKRFGFRSLYVSSRGGFDLATAALYLLGDSLKLGGVWIVDQWPKAKIVGGSWTPPPVDRNEIIAPSGGRDRFAMLAEAINVRRVGGGIIYGPGAKLTP